MNLTASGGDVASEANVTDIHEALNFARNEEVCGMCRACVTRVLLGWHVRTVPNFIAAIIS